MSTWLPLVGAVAIFLLQALNGWLLLRAVKSRGHWILTITPGEEARSEWHPAGPCACDRKAKAHS